jgi:hypothetical protein
MAAGRGPHQTCMAGGGLNLPVCGAGRLLLAWEVAEAAAGVTAGAAALGSCSSIANGLAAGAITTAEAAAGVGVGAGVEAGVTLGVAGCGGIPDITAGAGAEGDLAAVVAAMGPHLTAGPRSRLLLSWPE